MPEISKSRNKKVHKSMSYRKKIARLKEPEKKTTVEGSVLDNYDISIIRNCLYYVSDTTSSRAQNLARDISDSMDTATATTAHIDIIVDAAINDELTLRRYHFLRVAGIRQWRYRLRVSF